MTAAVDLPPQRGTTLLATGVRAAQPPVRRAPSDALASLFDAELRVGLEAADAPRATEAALALWRRSGDLLRCHLAVSRVLAALGEAADQGVAARAQANRVAATAVRVVAALRERTPPGPTGRVVLAAPDGEHHVLALESLAHLLEDAGWRADVCGALAPQDLAVAARGAVGVVLSVHLPSGALSALVAAVRQTAPDALVAVGGPAATAVAGADLVAPELPVLLDALRRGRVS